jgi:hypothetical protein
LRFLQRISEISFHECLRQLFPLLRGILFANLDLLPVITPTLIRSLSLLPLKLKFKAPLPLQLSLLLLHLSLVLEDTLKDHLVGGLVLDFPLILTTLAVALSVELSFCKVFEFIFEMHHRVFENGHFCVWYTVFEAVIFCLIFYLSFL